MCQGIVMFSVPVHCSCSLVSQVVELIYLRFALCVSIYCNCPLFSLTGGRADVSRHWNVLLSPYIVAALYFSLQVGGLIYLRFALSVSVYYSCPLFFLTGGWADVDVSRHWNVLSTYIEAANLFPLQVGGLMCLGIVMFSGSCYYHALTGNTSVRRVTPYGGMMIIAAWLAMML